MNKNEDKFIKRGKVIILVFGILTIFNIIILIGRNSSYALFRRTVTSNKRIVEIHVASEFPSKSGVDTLKKTLGQEGGLIGITEDNQMVTEKADNIREYRYSGLGVNNYVTFNDEKWRILGIFKDEEGQEHIKIVRNEVLPASVMPDTYTASGTSYKIRYSSSSATAYWNYTGSAYNNNWVKGGLKYWLNSEGTTDGYLKTLSSTAQNMIEDAKWYLGNIVYSTDTTIQAYEHERGSTPCSGSCSGGDICSGNEATWTGKIGLMYPSDYGFSASDTYWSGTKLCDYDGAARDTSWLYKEANHSTSTSEWLLSPSSYSSGTVAYWHSGGSVGNSGADSTYGVRPVLYLKSDIQVTGGEGTSDSPYELKYVAPPGIA